MQKDFNAQIDGVSVGIATTISSPPPAWYENTMNENCERSILFCNVNDVSKVNSIGNTTISYKTNYIVTSLSSR